MPSRAKRRKAAKKKKNKKTVTAVILNGNGELKVASQDLETQQNSFTSDENKEPHLSTESIEYGNSDQDDVNDSVKEGVNHGVFSKSTNGSLSRESVHSDDGDDGSPAMAMEEQKAENKDSKEVTDLESFVKDVGQFDPSDTSSSSKADNPPLSDASSGKSSRECFINQMPESTILINNSEWRAEMLEIQQCPEKEPLLPPAAGPANKTSWISCCGLLELFTSSNT